VVSALLSKEFNLSFLWNKDKLVQYYDSHKNPRITKVRKDLQDHPVEPSACHQYFPTKQHPLVQPKYQKIFTSTVILLKVVVIYKKRSAQTN